MPINVFKDFFTSYSGALAMIVAAIPAILGRTDLIPTLDADQKSFVQVYVSILSFFSIELIYFYRRVIGRIVLQKF